MVIISVHFTEGKGHFAEGPGNRRLAPAKSS